MAKQTKRKKGVFCDLRSFELLVQEAVASLPEEIKKNIENVAIIVEDDFPDKKISKEE